MPSFSDIQYTNSFCEEPFILRKLKRIPINDAIPHQVRAISAQENCWQKAVNLS